LTEIFGVTQIGWFIWLGVSLMTQKDTDKAIQPIADGLAD
jgi:hypothetical protein